MSKFSRYWGHTVEGAGSFPEKGISLSLLSKRIPRDGNGEGEEENTDPPKDGEGNTDPPSEEEDKEGSTQKGKEKKEKPKEVTFTAEQQEALNKLLAKARSEGRDAEKKAIEKAKQEQAGEYQKLYEEAKPLAEKVPELEATISKLQDRVHNQIDAEIKDWPQEVKEADPGKENLEVRENWVNKNRNLAKRLMGEAPPNGEMNTNSKDKKDAITGVTDYLDSKYTMVPGLTKK